MLRKAAAATAVALAIAGCAAPSGSGGDGRVHVVAAFYPLAFAAEQVGGQRVSVTTLTSPGVEPHDLELTPAQIVQIREADLVVYLPGFQPAVDAAVDEQAPDHSVDAAAGIALLAAPAPEGQQADPQQTDPHVWLNPLNMATIGQNVATGLTSADPKGATDYQAGQGRLATAMKELDGRWQQGTTTCASRDLVVSHEAFAYLAAQYGLTQVGIRGINPDTEPAPATLADVADFVRANHVRTVYTETLLDPKVADTLATETGARTAVLDPIEGIAVGSTATYTTLMDANLATVREGQPCR